MKIMHGPAGWVRGPRLNFICSPTRGMNRFDIGVGFKVRGTDFKIAALSPIYQSFDDFTFDVCVPVGNCSFVIIIVLL